MMKTEKPENYHDETEEDDLDEANPETLRTYIESVNKKYKDEVKRQNKENSSAKERKRLSWLKKLCLKLRKKS